MPTITDEMVDTLNQRLAAAGSTVRITRGSGRNLDYAVKLAFDKANPKLAPVLGSNAIQINCGIAPQHFAETVTSKLESSYSWYVKAGLNIGVSVETEVGAIFASAKAGLTVQVSLEGGSTTTKTESVEITREFPIIVSPMTKTTAQVVVKQEMVTNLPFTGTVVLNRGVFKAAPAGALPFYRYYNTNNGDHFYTSLESELGSGGGDWKFEGVAGYVHTTAVGSSVPLHRYYHRNSGDHFYTANFGELGRGRGDWKYEGVAGFVFPTQQPNTVPFHRYYNRGNGDHFYTTNFNELGNGGRDGWKYEGVTGFVFPDGLDVNIESLLPSPDARTFVVQGTFSGQSITSTVEVFILDKPMTPEECALRDPGAKASGAGAKASGAGAAGNKFYVERTPAKELRNTKLIMLEPGVRKLAL